MTHSSASNQGASQQRSPTVKTYDPNLQVTLYKMIKRTTLDGNNAPSQRFQGIDSTIDLTKYFGEGGSIRTTKSVREPAGGFSLTFGDQPLIGDYAGQHTFESFYGLIEPMDCIEIRFRHNKSDQSGQKPPIIMRGFVNEVKRNEAMGSDGKPQRSVTINGNDYGKIWQMLQIFYFPGFVLGEDILSGFKMFEHFGGAVDILPSSKFVAQVINTIVNPFLATFMPSGVASNQTANPALTPSATSSSTPVHQEPKNSIEVGQYLTVAHGVTSIQGPQNQEGTIYNILKTYGDVGPWNELFLMDDEDGVHCVYRPIPAIDLNSTPIQDDAPSPEYIDISDVDVISLNVSRSDANVANYYWTRAPRFELVDSIYQQLYALQGEGNETVLLTNYPNSTETLYGLRVMNADTQQGGDEVSSFSSNLRAPAQNARNTSMANWCNDRREIIVKMNRDNVLYESGSMRVRGNEGIKAGMYVRLHRGTFVATYYVVKVDHDYLPYQGVFSTITFERGTGFIERVKRNGGKESPYLAEQMPTPALT